MKCKVAGLRYDWPVARKLSFPHPYRVTAYGKRLVSVFHMMCHRCTGAMIFIMVTMVTRLLDPLPFKT